MIVSRDKLIQYSIPEQFYFARRVGEGSPISRDEYFNNNPIQLVKSAYCAIGNDTDGWELEMYNGVNWVVVTPEESYSLTITNDGLAALTNVKQGTTQLKFSGLKIIDQTILNPATPLIQWTDTTFLAAGNVVFSVGTRGAAHSNPEELKHLLRWRFNSSSGGLQYILTLPADGLGSTADDRSSTWNIGAIGLYVKDPDDQTTDVLFAVATLPELVTKHASTIEMIGNTIKLYFNTILTNLGVVSNLNVLADNDVSLPEVQNETLLTYPIDAEQDPNNCYLVNNLYGTNIPALAIKKTIDASSDSEWIYIQPSDNFTILPAEAFDQSVNNYDFVYWDATAEKYKLAEGKTNSTENNEKMPIGIRVGNSIVYTGVVTNTSTSYEYSIDLISSGTNYRDSDELLIAVNGALTFKVIVNSIQPDGGINGFTLIGPTVGDLEIPGGEITLPAIYDPRSQLPRDGYNARFKVTSTRIPSSQWNFPASWLNKPLYCSWNNDPVHTSNPQLGGEGKPTITETDSMVGWCISSNAIKLGFDVRNEATTTKYGTVRYATNAEVKEVLTNSQANYTTAICPKTLNDNYLQISKPSNTNQKGSSINKPIEVNSFVKFKQTVLGKNTASYGTTYMNDANIDFYGCSYRAWYADLAEFYEADKYYEAGTLISIGGVKEITVAKNECNGIISTNPGFELGNKLSDMHLPVALVGRVPVLFDGNCMPKFGDKIYLSKIIPGRASTVPNGNCLGKIVAKSFGTNKLIECIIRIDF